MLVSKTFIGLLDNPLNIAIHLNDKEKKLLEASAQALKDINS
jgi:hypothetical protein